ncbi:MAG: nucleotidyl transferase AbiEii/AbiGii toxin family protein [Phycisphaerae bacterium]|jgi:predicted nucleotidyltransferase component of viral defense system|nr:nucleotidyl transferase AbiEii/AbiGii toxin family protein [Phycisphaerae bacterium]
MDLFDELVTQALLSQAALGTVRPAVEKELLHHDILREMSRAGLLTGLTFIGGTCLRMCYGSQRLSEDLDFTGGSDFHPDKLTGLTNTLESTLMEKYGLPVSVSDPQLETGNVSTWKLRLETQPSQKQLPTQRIHIDICALPSHQQRPSLLRNHYGVDMGTDGLIVQAESREEILADKWVALAMRPNRVQYRDLWDIIYLQQRGVELSSTLVGLKLSDRGIATSAFGGNLQQRIDELAADERHRLQFTHEMRRFLPGVSAAQAFEDPKYWSIVIGALERRPRP